MQGPTSTSQAVGKWAEFNCTVACTHSINWYIEGYSGEIANSCNTMQGGMKVCTEVVHQCQDETSTTGYTENLRVMVSEELAGSRIAVQCAGLALSFSTSSCTPIISYSIMAFLTSNKTECIDVLIITWQFTFLHSTRDTNVCPLILSCHMSLNHTW